MGTLTTILACIVAVPLVLSVLLAYWQQWVWAATVIIVPAIPLQLLGFTGTCTQGADGPFVTGAVLSTPLLLGAICLLLWGLYQRRAPRLACSVLAVTTLAMLALTREAWFNSLRFGTPCGADYAYSSNHLPPLIILGGYLILPLLLAACAAWRTVRN